MNLRVTYPDPAGRRRSIAPLGVAIASDGGGPGSGGALPVVWLRRLLGSCAAPLFGVNPGVPEVHRLVGHVCVRKIPCLSPHSSRFCPPRSRGVVCVPRRGRESAGGSVGGHPVPSWIASLNLNECSVRGGGAGVDRATMPAGVKAAQGRRGLHVDIRLDAGSTRSW